MATDKPLEVLEDEASGDRFLIYAAEDGVELELRVEGQTFWATQRQMAEAFGVSQQNISLHLRNIFDEGELAEAAVYKDSLYTAADGKRYRVGLYDINAFISVGYRVGGKLGTAFRIWATDKLFRYLTKGFVVDRKRLKAAGQNDRIAELREIVRDIRASEANVYAELRRICSLCQDYDPKSEQAREFYTHMQAKLYWATVSRTPSMVIADRADAAAPNMGLQTWAKRDLLQSDATTAKNYLAEPELRELNRLTTILLDIFEDQLEIGKLTLMDQASNLLDMQLANLSRPVLRGGGSTSRDDAERHAKAEYRKFDDARRARRAQETLQELQTLKKIGEDLPKPKRRPKP